MPGILSTHRDNTLFVTDWFLYRSGITAIDDPTHPALVLPVIDLSRNPAGISAQIWVTAELVAGGGGCDLTLFADGFGSLSALIPYNEGETKSLVHLSEVRFTDLIAVPHRVLLTGMTPGAEWNLHCAYTL